MTKGASDRAQENEHICKMNSILKITSYLTHLVTLHGLKVQLDINNYLIDSADLLHSIDMKGSIRPQNIDK